MHDPTPTSEAREVSEQPAPCNSGYRSYRHRGKSRKNCATFRLSVKAFPDPKCAENSCGVFQSASNSFGFQFETPRKRKHTFLPSTASSPSNSQQAPRQTGQADCSTQQLEPAGVRRGRDLRTVDTSGQTLPESFLVFVWSRSKLLPKMNFIGSYLVAFLKTQCGISITLQMSSYSWGTPCYLTTPMIS